jgi:8-oxo-dGTP diphosphatase
MILAPGSVEKSKLKYVVLAAREKGLWVFVRHRERISWEMPAGHIEKGESAEEAAFRELSEETGALDASLKHLCDYRVSVGGKTEAGRLYSAEIHSRKSTLEHEIEELQLADELPASLTYPEVQTLLFRHAKELLRS